MTAYRFKPGVSVAERIDLARSLSVRDSVPRVFGIAPFLKTWQSGLVREGIAPFPIPSLPSRLSLRSCREKLAYFLTYYVGSIALSPHLGEPSISVLADESERLVFAFSAPYLKKDTSFLLDVGSALRISSEQERLLAAAARELGVSVMFDRTQKELKIVLSLPILAAEKVGVREESAIERAALLSAVAAAFADLRRL